MPAVLLKLPGMPQTAEGGVAELAIAVESGEQGVDEVDEGRVVEDWDVEDGDDVTDAEDEEENVLDAEADEEYPVPL